MWVKVAGMVSVIALLCAATIVQSDCTRDNTIDVASLADAPDELSWMRDSMLILASLAIRDGPNEYWKVICESVTTPEAIAPDQR
jgi:hypothetical protein